MKIQANHYAENPFQGSDSSALMRSNWSFMKGSLCLAFIFLIGAQIADAQIYADEVNVVTGLNGNVGIGISPAANTKLRVKGHTYISERLSITNESKVGATLTLKGRYNGTANTYAIFQASQSSAKLIDFVETSSGTYFRMYENDTAENLITSSGYSWFYGNNPGTSDRLGIGTKTPSERLEVIGNIKVSGKLMAAGEVNSASFDTNGGSIIIKPQDGPLEGGELVLTGAPNKIDWVLDNFDGKARFHHDNVEYLTITSDGKVGIGDPSPNDKLKVVGTVRADTYYSSTTTYADFVFKDTYQLPPLSEVETFIKQNKHLPEIPTEAEVMKDGINLTEMNVKLLQKVEELTLYLIEQNKQIAEQKARMDGMEKELKSIKK